jgi:ABC-type transport system involved in multi-copper enzyme maturation permease subunit
VNALRNLYRRIDQIQQSRWFKVVASIVAVVGAVGLVVTLRNAPAEVAPEFLQHSTPAIWSGLLLSLWLLLLIWMEVALTYVLIIAGGAVVSSLLLLIGAGGLALAVAGFATLSLTFVLLIRLLLLAFRYPSRIFAVAHTVVKESVRLRVSVSFIILLLVLLPLIPFMLGSERELAYRIQSFIQYSTAATFYLAACMTIFLACGSVAFEIRDRQIWQLLTKPLSRAQYLVGKWLGIVAVNLAILLVTGLSIFMFVQYLRYQPAANERDYRAVNNEVLVARVAAYPRYDAIDPETLRAEVDRRINSDFELQGAIQRGERNEMSERRRLAREFQDETLRLQRTVPPGQAREYVFRGLEKARDLRLPMKLRFRIHYGGDNTHEVHPISFIFVKNATTFIPPPEVSSYFHNPQSWDYVPTMSQSIDLPWQLVGDQGEWDGTVRIVLINGVFGPDGRPRPGANTPLSLNFDAEDLEILYTVGGFEANYFRAMLVYWVKLAFVAMLGLAAATVLSFPVATLLTFTVFLAATIGPFLAMSLEEYVISDWWRIDRVIVKALAQLMVFLFEPFGEYNPTARLVDGRMIAWSGVLRAFLLLGLLWSGITLAIGYLAFRDKELATYSGHG